MKKITLILISVLTGSIVYGQQIPMYSQYYQTPFIYNPANTGTSGNTTIGLVNHSQWVDMPGGPITRAIMVDGPIQDKKAGLGLIIYNDITDITSKIAAYGSYSYRIKPSETTNLMFGLSVGVIENKIDFSKIIVKDANDLSLFGQSQNKTAFDANAGVMFNWKKLDVGVSVPQLGGNTIIYTNNYSHSDYQMARHYLATAKYTFDISKDQNIHLTPLVLARYIPGAPFQYDINALFDWKDIVGVGVTYKSNYAVTGNAYVKVHQSFKIGYSYDYILSPISSYAGTSHEVFLSYTFGVSKRKELDELKAANDTLKKQNAENKEAINKNNDQLNKNSDQLNKTNVKVDSLQKEIDKVKGDIQKTNDKTDKLEKDMNTAAENNRKAAPLNDDKSSSSDKENKKEAKSSKKKDNNSDENNSNKSDENSGKNNKKNKKNSDKENKEKDADANKVKDSNAGAENNGVDKPVKIGAIDADGIRSISKVDFKDKNGNPVKTGYYVVVGTFYYYDYAIAEVQRFINRGYEGTTYIFYSPLHYHYLFINCVQSKEESLDLCKKVKAIQSDAWILNITE